MAKKRLSFLWNHIFSYRKQTTLVTTSCCKNKIWDKQPLKTRNKCNIFFSKEKAKGNIRWTPCNNLKTYVLYANEVLWWVEKLFIALMIWLVTQSFSVMVFWLVYEKKLTRLYNKWLTCLEKKIVSWEKNWEKPLLMKHIPSVCVLLWTYKPLFHLCIVAESMVEQFSFFLVKASWILWKNPVSATVD